MCDEALTFTTPKSSASEIVQSSEVVLEVVNNTLNHAVTVVGIKWFETNVTQMNRRAIASFHNNIGEGIL